MTDPAVYLKPNVVLEPLYQQWYAWPHLISPATAALNVVNRHIRIMESYIKSPTVHRRFSRNPAMLGAPFMAHPVSRVDEVKELLERTVRDYPHVIAFAGAIADLVRLLGETAQGYSLNSLYPEVPDILKGYVELSYNRQNRADFRVLEALLYRSRYYDASAQSVAMSIIEHDEREFVLSTPRLEDDGVLHLRIPFAHPGLDALFRTRQTPGSYYAMREQLGVGDGQEPTFRKVFSPEPPPRGPAEGRERVRIKYFGHACILVEAGDVSFLTDPAVTSAYDSSVPRFTFSDLPDRIDYVLITHNHQDHVLFDTLLQLRHKIGHIVVPRSSGGTLQDPSLYLMFTALGFDSVIQLDEMESLRAGDCRLLAVPFLGEHADLDVRSKLAYHLRLPTGFTLLLMADSCNVEPRLYRHVHAEIGDVDMLFLGMECDGAPLSWLYGPLLPDRLPREMDHSRRLAGSDRSQGMELVSQFRPSDVYVYAMGEEPWLRHIMGLKYVGDSRPIVESNALVSECQERGIRAERLFGRKLLNRPA